MELHEIDKITGHIVASAIKVHRAFGPGMFETAYEKCLFHELIKLGLQVERQVVIPLIYDGTIIDIGYRLDLRVAGSVIVEIKCVDAVLPIHKTQLLSYLKMSNLRVGLLINFNVRRLVDGVTRMIL